MPRAARADHAHDVHVGAANPVPLGQRALGLVVEEAAGREHSDQGNHRPAALDLLAQPHIARRGVRLDGHRLPPACAHGRGEHVGGNAGGAAIDERRKVGRLRVGGAPISQHHGERRAAAEIFGLRQERHL